MRRDSARTPSEGMGANRRQTAFKIGREAGQGTPRPGASPLSGLRAAATRHAENGGCRRDARRGDNGDEEGWRGHRKPVRPAWGRTALGKASPSPK
jgi:hypothetical protein